MVRQIIHFEIVSFRVNYESVRVMTANSLESSLLFPAHTTRVARDAKWRTHKNRKLQKKLNQTNCIWPPSEDSLWITYW